MKAKSKLKDGTFKYGSVEMTREELLEASNPKVRTTMFLEASLIRAYKQAALKRGLKYQQLMREKLRSGLEKDLDFEDRLNRLEKKLLRTGT